MKMLRISALAVGLLMAATACASADHSVTVDATGASGASGSARHQVLTAATTTSAYTTGRFTVTTSISGGALGRGTGPITVTGAFDRAHHATEAELSSPALAHGSGSVVLVGGVEYIELGDLGGMLGIDTPWVSLDLAGFAAAHGLADKFPAASGSNDPQSLLDLLKGVSDQVTTVGSDSVAGVATTHYRASVVPAKALTQLSPAEQAKLNQALGSLQGDVGSEVNSALNTPIAVDVWIDRSGRVLKGTETVDESSLGTVSTTYQLSDLGQPVSIVAPPASQVTPASAIPLFKSLFGGH